MGSGSMGDDFKRVSDGLTRLVRDHVELARSELVESARRAGRDGALAIVGAILLAMAWWLVAFAVGYGLGERIGFGRGFLLVAALHAIPGLGLCWTCLRRLRGPDRPRLDATTAELARDRALLRALRSTPRAP